MRLTYADASPSPKHVLFFVTSHGELNGTGRKTGFWLDGLATPYYVFREAGYRISIASVDGLKPPIDPRSEQEATAAGKRFLRDPEAMKLLSDTIPLSEVKADGYDAIFFPGGHGMLWDCSDNTVLNVLLWNFASKHKIIAAVDHGPVALLTAQGADGRPLVKGRRVTGFTKEEEDQLGLLSAIAIYVDRSLADAGAVVTRAAPFQPHAVQDGNLITGQNPASIEKVARLTLAALKKQGQ